MDFKEKPPDDFFKGIKLSLKSVLKHPDINTPKITNAVIQCNKIVINVLLFMKLYLLDYYETHKVLPIIDKVFINPQRSNSDLSSRIIVRKGQFAYCTQLNNENVAIAYRKGDDCVVSTVYNAFEIKQQYKNILFPEKN